MIYETRVYSAKGPGFNVESPLTFLNTYRTITGPSNKYLVYVYIYSSRANRRCCSELNSLVYHGSS